MKLNAFTGSRYHRQDLDSRSEAELRGLLGGEQITDDDTYAVADALERRARATALSSPTIAVLSGLLRHPAQDVRSASIEALSASEGTAAEAALVDALWIPERFVMFGAALAIWRRAIVGACPALRARLAGEGEGVDVVPAWAFIGALMYMHRPPSESTLRVWAVDQNSTTRKVAAEALADIGTEEAREALTWAAGQLSQRAGKYARRSLARIDA